MNVIVSILNTGYSIHPSVASVVLLVVPIRYRLLVICVINLIFDAPVYMQKLKFQFCINVVLHCGIVVSSVKLVLY